MNHTAKLECVSGEGIIGDARNVVVFSSDGIIDGYFFDSVHLDCWRLNVEHCDERLAMLPATLDYILMYRVVQTKRNPSFNVAITSVNVHRF